MTQREFRSKYSKHFSYGPVEKFSFSKLLTIVAYCLFGAAGAASITLFIIQYINY